MLLAEMEILFLNELIKTKVMEQSESIKEIAAALVSFHKEVGKVKKSETNPFFKSKYADLSSILDVIETPLNSAGLSFVQFPIGEHELMTMLMHTSGEWIKGSYKMTPTKNDPQGAGSVITYQRRYALGAILGLNIDIDDDGNKASKEITKKLSTTAEMLPLIINCKAANEVTNIWTNNVHLQKDLIFKNAIADKGNSFKDPKEVSFETNK